MISEILYRLSDLERRFENVLRVGVVETVNLSEAKCTVRIGKISTAELPWLTQRAAALSRTWWAPEVGEQVLILSPSGELSQGLILPAIYQNSFAAPKASADESFIKFGACEITLNKDGNINVKGNQLTFDTALQKNTGQVQVEGDVTAIGEVTGKGIALSSHVHGGVQGGPSTTAAPQ